MTDVNHEPGPSITQSARRDGLDGLVARGRAGGQDADRGDDAGRGGDAVLAAHLDRLVGTLRVVAADLGDDLQRLPRHRQHPAPGPQQAADEVEALDGVVEQLPDRDDHEVAEGVPGEVARPREAVLQHVAPGVPPLAVVAERRERHAQVAGRQHVELVAEATARSAVVGDGDDGGDAVGEQAQRGQGGRQAVAATERDDAAVVGGDEGPRRRWRRWRRWGHGRRRSGLTHARDHGARRRCRPGRSGPAGCSAPRRWRPSGACRPCIPPPP